MSPRQRPYDPYGKHKRNQENRKALSVVYPIFAYFAVCQIVSILLGLLPSAGQIDAVKRQGLGSLTALVVLYIGFVHRKATIYDRSERNRGDHNNMEKTESLRIFAAPVSGRFFTGMLAAALLLGCAGIAMNNLIALTNIKQLSDGYQTVEQAFYSSSLGWEILSLGVITPIAEELLYRYIIFYRLRDLAGRAGAIIGSALIFGLIHLNIVQTIYACVLGLLLGVLMEYYQDVRVAMCGHIAANILSLLRGETGFLAWLQPGNGLFLPVTCGLFLIVAVIAGWHVRTFRNK